MLDWWHSLDGFTRFMYGAAIFFGVIFVYEVLAAFTGIGADSDAESSPAHDTAANDAQQASHSTAVFKLFSVRSIVAFFTLFCWGTALYASSGKSHDTALALGTAWGVAAMVVVSAVVHFMRGLAYDPKARLKDSVGSEVTVHFDIPPGGEGEVRLLFGGAITHCRAREARGTAAPAGSRARVTRVLGPNLVEVERL